MKDKNNGNGYRKEMDFEKIVIYPEDYDEKTRKRLYDQMRALGVTFFYEKYS